ncbi:GL20134 [Drosophila persimilis]|uniref:GL20134 n=1 Tax=Drosophila persimilis TaxID=7234 RepID=B4IRK2_DROPE|nr:GL20134 [Drosophila persimilis]
MSGDILYGMAMAVAVWHPHDDSTTEAAIAFASGGCRQVLVFSRISRDSVWYATSLGIL